VMVKKGTVRYVVIPQPCGCAFELRTEGNPIHGYLRCARHKRVAREMAASVNKRPLVFTVEVPTWQEIDENVAMTGGWPTALRRLESGGRSGEER
jgi:hypothetical protein